MNSKLEFLIAKWQVKLDYINKYWGMPKLKKSIELRNKEHKQVLQFIHDLESLNDLPDERSILQGFLDWERWQSIRGDAKFMIDGYFAFKNRSKISEAN